MKGTLLQFIAKTGSNTSWISLILEKMKKSMVFTNTERR